MSESAFQRKLIRTLNLRFPGCIIRKQDTYNYQGSPDLAIFYKNKWAMLECKDSEDAPHQPNQDYWVDKFNSMSYAAFVYPENVEEVLNELESAFGT